MIAQIQGRLLQLDSSAALVEVGAVAYEVMLPGYAVTVLSGRIGEQITLCTMQYFEGSPKGGLMQPRIVGFLNTAEREFFRRFISVKGIGIRKGLRSLSIPIATIASAIENSDSKTLMALPEIGSRLSQQIVAELKGKVQGFAAGAAVPEAQQKLEVFQAEALEILIAWGEKRAEAMELIALACRRHPEVKSAEQLVPLVYRIKQGVEV
jgi:Holliday junction DNA helicase RuvA